MCSAGFDEFVGDDVEVRLLSNGSGGTVLGSFTGVEEIPPGQLVRLRCHVRGDEVHTTLTALLTHEASVNDGNYVSGRAGLRVRNLDVDIHWFSVIALGP
jgi:hypothetical protein